MSNVRRRDRFSTLLARRRTRHTRPTVEGLEQRLALSTYYVANGGNDAAAGTGTAPWAHLQHAADVVKAGDTVIVRQGSYAGFVLSWDTPTAGTAAAPITFQADPAAPADSVVINARNNQTHVGIDLEPGSDYITISGFLIQGAGGIANYPTRGSGIKVAGNNCSIVGNTVANIDYGFGITSDGAANILIQGNTVTGTGDHGNTSQGHGIYIAGSTDGAVVRGNVIHDNAYTGLQFNGDPSTSGGNGLVTHALVEGNLIYNNGQNGINADGLQSSVIRNNLFYGYQSSGICLFQIDASGPSKGNVIVDDTFAATAAGAGAAIRILNGGTGNTLLNDVLLGGGGITYRIASDSLPGLVSDYNVVGSLFQSEDSGATQTLAQWRAQTGQDAHSFTASAAQMFVAPAAGDYHPLSTSPTIDRGTAQQAPLIDLDGKPRPSGAGFDIGAYEYQWGADTTPPTVTGESPAPGATGVAASASVTATFSESVQPSSVVFTLVGPGGAVAATFGYSDTTHTATLTPSAALAASTTYTASLSGAKDLAGNTMSGPVTWSFTTAPVGASVWSQTTAADFGSGTLSGTAVTNNAGGEVQLAPALSDEFNGTALGSAWVNTPLSNPSTTTVSGGVVSLISSQIFSATSFAPAALEGRVSFGAAPWLAFGLADGLANGSTNSWAIFSTKGTTNTLYARVNSAGVNTIANLGALPTGYHVYRVEPVSGGFAFSIDGVRKTTLSITLPAGIQLHAVLQADDQPTQPALQADWVHLLSNASSGTFTSSVFDAGRTATWGTATWTASAPTGTTLVVETSSSVDGTTWSSWSGVGNGGTPASPSGRYLRYRVTMTSTIPSATPVFSDIAIRWS
jgi:hypothetical protein